MTSIAEMRSRDKLQGLLSEYGVLVVSLVSFVCAAWLGFVEQRNSVEFRTTAVETSATIRGFWSNEGPFSQKARRRTYYAGVKFVDQAGRAQYKRANVSKYEMKRLEVGQQVQLWYSPSRPYVNNLFDRNRPHPGMGWTVMALLALIIAMFHDGGARLQAFFVPKD
jgi:Protein of unknown function (DUF3592)